MRQKQAFRATRGLGAFRSPLARAPADLDGDGDVDTADLSIFAAVNGTASLSLVDPLVMYHRSNSFRGGYLNGASGEPLCSVGHQGLLHDEEFGLIYNRARMLHPTLGRFVQRDPLGYVDGMSVYQYLMSMPIIAYDVSGTTANLRHNHTTLVNQSSHNAKVLGDWVRVDSHYLGIREPLYEGQRHGIIGEHERTGQSELLRMSEPVDFAIIPAGTTSDAERDAHSTKIVDVDWLVHVEGVKKVYNDESCCLSASLEHLTDHGYSAKRFGNLQATKLYGAFPKGNKKYYLRDCPSGIDGVWLYRD